MPLVSCPKCSTHLKVPDGATAAVRCPKCQTIFKPAPPAPAFEVVDDKPAPPPKPAPRPAAPSAVRPSAPSTARPAPKPAPRLAAADDFEVVDDRPAPKKKALSLDDDEDDRPRSRKRRDDDEEDDDRPRGRRRRDEDEDEDDRPRKKGRRDDEDDRPRGKRKGRRDEDDYDDYDNYDYTPPPKGSKFGVGRVGLLLVLISLGLYAGSMGLHALFLLIAIIGGSIPSGLSVVTGILALGNWIVGIVGLGLCIAGPARSRGLAIAAISVAVVHLILAFVVVNDNDSIGGGSFALPVLSSLNKAESFQKKQKELMKELEKNPSSARAKELREELSEDRDGERSGSQMRWYDLSTQLMYPDRLVGILAYESKYFTKTYYLLGFFGGLAELARLILIAIMIGSMARVAKRSDAQSKAKVGWIVAASGAGACLLIILLTFVIMDSYKNDAKKFSYNPPPPPNTMGMDFQQAQRANEEYRKQLEAEAEKQMEKAKSSVRAPMVWLGVGDLLVYLVHTGSLVMPALAALAVFSATSRKGR